LSLSLKLLVDADTPSQLIATGSSSFERAGELGEPLTGRQVALRLYPLSQLELRAFRNRAELREHVEEHLIYGSYPEVVTAGSLSEKRRILDEPVGSYLLKDVLELDLLEKGYVLINVRGFSRNLRKEITKKSKYHRSHTQ
jgi:hypothetical protein